VLDHDDVLRMTSAKVIEGVPECEIDFVVIRHSQGKIEWALGEAKSGGGRIDAEDVAHMIEVAEKLEQVDEFYVYLVFSKTADSFSPEEIELFKTAKKAGYGVILLTNKEIEPYHPYYESDDKDALPHPYAHSFDEMARNSYYRYLRPAPVGDGDVI
jgi:hypothetical protein